MSSLSSQEIETSGQLFYNRKEKSLGVLVSNFLRLYNRDGVDLIGLDDAAGKLGVERRRIYDVVNILESVGLMTRCGKNQYLWKGFGELPQALKELKAKGLRQNFGMTEVGSIVKDELLSSTNNEQENSSSSKTDTKREKSLWLLAQNFVKLFICSDVEVITLDKAAKALLSESQDSMTMRTKVRRLYDIANVFTSMNLIEKTHVPDTRKPAYKWLGWRGNPVKQSNSAPDLNEPKKRVFGTEITNLNSKRNKSDLVIQTSNQKDKAFIHTKNNNQESLCTSKSKTDQNSKPSSKNFVFGPFGPAGASRMSNPGGHNLQRVQDSVSLASSYRPRYRNQDLADLFGHYMDAWKSWHAEVAGKPS